MIHRLFCNLSAFLVTQAILITSIFAQSDDLFTGDPLVDEAISRWRCNDEILSFEKFRRSPRQRRAGFRVDRSTRNINQIYAEADPLDAQFWEFVEDLRSGSPEQRHYLQLIQQTAPFKEVMKRIKNKERIVTRSLRRYMRAAMDIDLAYIEAHFPGLLESVELFGHSSRIENIQRTLFYTGDTFGENEFPEDEHLVFFDASSVYDNEVGYSIVSPSIALMNTGLEKTKYRLALYRNIVQEAGIPFNFYENPAVFPAAYIPPTYRSKATAEQKQQVNALREFFSFIKFGEAFGESNQSNGDATNLAQVIYNSSGRSLASAFITRDIRSMRALELFAQSTSGHYKDEQIEILIEEISREDSIVPPDFPVYPGISIIRIRVKAPVQAEVQLAVPDPSLIPDIGE